MASTSNGSGLGAESIIFDQSIRTTSLLILVVRCSSNKMACYARRSFLRFSACREWVMAFHFEDEGGGSLEEGENDQPMRAQLVSAACTKWRSMKSGSNKL